MSVALERFLGRLLRKQRGRDDGLVWNDSRLIGVPDSIHLRSPDFSDGGMMPARCAAAGAGDNVSPGLEWSGVPADAIELVLVMEDPDAPLPKPIVHLIAYGITPGSQGIAAGCLNAPAASPIRLGRGAFGRVGYAGPRPIRSHGGHRYLFQLFALSKALDITAEPSRSKLLQLMNGHVIARGRTIGIYERS